MGLETREVLRRCVRRTDFQPIEDWRSHRRGYERHHYEHRKERGRKTHERCRRC